LPLAGRYKAVVRGHVETFGDYAERWLDDAVHLRPGTIKKYEGRGPG
jgi:hypothetical protein